MCINTYAHVYKYVSNIYTGTHTLSGEVYDPDNILIYCLLYVSS